MSTDVQELVFLSQFQYVINVVQLFALVRNVRPYVHVLCLPKFSAIAVLPKKKQIKNYIAPVKCTFNE